MNRMNRSKKSTAREEREKRSCMSCGGVGFALMVVALHLAVRWIKAIFGGDKDA